MQNCTSCDRTFQFTVWNWNNRGWKDHHEKKPGSVKCSGCKGYGYTETYHLGADVTTKKCHVSTCNNGWVECGKCYGKGQKIGYVALKEITKNTEWISKYKVFTPRANNIGTELNDDNLNTFIGKPNTVCTESYIVVGINLELKKISAF